MKEYNKTKFLIMQNNSEDLIKKINHNMRVKKFIKNIKLQVKN